MLTKFWIFRKNSFDRILKSSKFLFWKNFDIDRILNVKEIFILTKTLKFFWIRLVFENFKYFFKKFKKLNERN